MQQTDCPKSTKMWTIMKPHVEKYLSMHVGAIETRRKKLTVLRNFLINGSWALTPADVTKNICSPETLFNHIKKSTFAEDGYLNWDNPDVKLTAKTLSQYSFYIMDFVQDLLKDRSYYPGHAAEKMETLKDCERLLLQNQRKLRKPMLQQKQEHREKEHATAIKTKYIKEFLQGQFISDAKTTLKSELNLNRESARKLKNDIMTYIVCHSVRRCKELLFFSLDQAAGSNFVLKESHASLSEDVFIYNTFTHKTGHKESARFVLPSPVAEVLDSYIRKVRPIFTNGNCKGQCPVFPNSVKPSADKCCEFMTFNQVNLALTRTFTERTTITEADLGGKHITPRRLRKSNITAFKSCFKDPESIKNLCKLASHSQQTSEKFYDFSESIDSLLRAHSQLETSQGTSAESLVFKDCDDIVKEYVLKRKRSNKQVKISKLAKKLKGKWSLDTISNKVEGIQRKLNS